MKILINTDWLKFIKDLTPEKQNEVMLAILDYPNRECTLSCWEVIKPELEKGRISYFNRLKALKQNNPVTEPSRTPSRSKDGDKDIDKDIYINKDINNSLKEKEIYKEKETKYPDEFLKFMEYFPKSRKDSKSAVYPVYKKILQSRDITAEQLTLKSKEYSESEDALKDNGKFAKGTIAWLRGGWYNREFKKGGDNYAIF